MRTRSRESDGRRPDAEFLDRFELGLDGEGHTVWGGPIDQYLRDDEPATEHTAQFMQDESQHGIRHFNSCRNAKVLADYGRYEKSSLGYIRYGILPEAVIDGYENPFGHSAWGGVSNQEVIAAAKLQLSRRPVPPFSELPSRVEEKLRIFGDPRLKFRFPIKSDPFDTDFSIWYLIVDLIDAKKLVKRLTTSLVSGGRPRFKQKTAKKRKGMPRISVSSKGQVPLEEMTAKQLHDAHLLTKFGIIPTVADIQEFIATVQRWKRTMKEASSGETAAKRYVAHVNKPNSEFRKLVNDAEFEDWEETVSCTLPFFSLGSPLTVKVKSKTTVSWHGQALYGFVCPELHGWVSRLAQICDSFGLADPAAVWDVVPFSFIVDWFYSVSSWLHNNRPRVFRATPVIYDYLESIRIETRVSYTLTAGYVNSSPPYYTVRTDDLGTELYTLYLRERFYPGTENVVLVPRRGFSNEASFATVSNRIAISSSLTAQHLPR